jgi:hypothetical protein
MAWRTFGSYIRRSVSALVTVIVENLNLGKEHFSAITRKGNRLMTFMPDQVASVFVTVDIVIPRISPSSAGWEAESCYFDVKERSML